MLQWPLVPGKQRGRRPRRAVDTRRGPFADVRDPQPLALETGCPVGG